MFGYGCVAKVFDLRRPLDLAKGTTLIISYEEMNDILKVIKSLEESGLLIKAISETSETKIKQSKRTKM